VTTGYSSGDVQRALGLTRNGLKRLTNSGVITASATERNGTGHRRRFSQADVVAIGIAHQITKLGVARPGLLSAWLKGIEYVGSAIYVACRSDGRVEAVDTHRGVQGQLSTCDAAIVINVHRATVQSLTSLTSLNS